MRVADQRKKCRDDDDREQCIRRENPAVLRFDIVTGNIPKRAHRGPPTICAQPFECDRMVVVIGNRRPVTAAHCRIKRVAAAGFTGC